MTRGTGDRIIFQRDCIFCRKVGRKKVKKQSSWTTEATTTFDYEGGKTVQALAEEKNCEELLIRIRGVNLFSCEARYHPSCRKQFTKDPSYWRSKDQSNKEEQDTREKAHSKAFHTVCKFVESTLVHHKGIVKLTDLTKQYIEALSHTSHPNPHYRPNKLRLKLEKTYPVSLTFLTLPQKGTFQPTLVYSSDIDVSMLIQKTYDLRGLDHIKDAALTLQREIISAYTESAPKPWPPTAQQLEEGSEDVLPECLVTFLRTLLISNEEASTRTHRLLLSIGQDICRAVTSGHWKMPKHILLSMALRHLFRSKELTTLINRFGHCENYLFSLELETALADAVDQSSALLTNQIVLNPQGRTVFHSEFDNFDKNTASGSVHTAHGIMLQEVDASQKVGI